MKEKEKEKEKQKKYVLKSWLWKEDGLTYYEKMLKDKRYNSERVDRYYTSRMERRDSKVEFIY
jgi:hypothetical protein